MQRIHVIWTETTNLIDYLDFVTVRRLRARQKEKERLVFDQGRRIQNTSSRGFSSNLWQKAELKLKLAQLGVCEA